MSGPFTLLEDVPWSPFATSRPYTCCNWSAFGSSRRISRNRKWSSCGTTSSFDAVSSISYNGFRPHRGVDLAPPNRRPST